jgi:predicted phage terminase large subunit-like protein
MSFTETIREILTMLRKHPDTNQVLVEAKANGPAIINTLKAKIPGIIEIEPRGSKEARVDACSPLYESGNVFHPGEGTAQHSEWVSDFEDELLRFPAAKHDDDVDAMSQYLNTKTIDLDIYLNLLKQ